MTTQAEAPSLSWLALPAVTMRAFAADRLQPGEAFERGLGAIALVLGDGHVVHRNRAGFLVLDAHLGGDGHDLGVEPAGGLRGGGAALRFAAHIRRSARGEMP